MRYRTVPLLAALLVMLPISARAGTVDRVGAAATGPVVGLPGELTAGATLPVAVSGVSGEVTLTVLGSWGTAVRTAAAVDGVATFALPAEITRGAGTLTLVADNDGQVGTGTVTVLPGPVVGPLLPIVGARSIVADAADLSMVVTVPVDEWGNSIAEGSAVTVVHRDPTGTTSTRDATVDHLLGWVELTSGTVAGRGNVWLRSGPNDGATGQQVSLDEVPGPPLPFTFAPVDPTLPTRLGADGQTLVLMRTSVLADPYGNVEPDGTVVTVAWSGPAGVSRSSAVTISGVAEIYLQAPTVPGTLTVTGSSRGTVTAAAVDLVFPAVVTDIPVDTHTDARGLVVRIGPVNRTGGTYVPDGTVATLALSDADGHRVTAAKGLVDGIAEVLMPTSSMVGTATLSVAVLGVTTTVNPG